MSEPKNCIITNNYLFSMNVKSLLLASIVLHNPNLSIQEYNEQKINIESNINKVKSNIDKLIKKKNQKKEKKNILSKNNNIYAKVYNIKNAQKRNRNSKYVHYSQCVL